MKTEVLEDTVADTTRGATSDMLSQPEWVARMASTSAANRGILKHQIRRVPYFDSNTLTYQVPHRSKLYFYPPSRAPDILFGTGGLYLTETAKSVTARAVAKAASASAGASTQTGASLASAASNSSATATASSAITAAASASPPPPPQTPAGRRASSNRHSPTPDGGVDGSDSRSLRGARETPVPSSPARPGRPRRKAAVPAEDRAAAAAESICTKCYEPCARDDADKRSISCGDCGHQFHTKCLEWTPKIADRVRSFPSWQCVDCKVCTQCHAVGDEGRLLFCDQCDRGFHMDCLPEPLTQIPEGDWSCPECA